MIKLAEWLVERNETLSTISVLMFSGEAFHADQEVAIRKAFPNARVHSLVYGSIDAGALGYSISDADTRLHILLHHTLSWKSVLMETHLRHQMVLLELFRDEHWSTPAAYDPIPEWCLCGMDRL